MLGTKLKSAAPRPADSSSGHAAPDSLHAGRYRRSRRSPCPAGKEAGKSHQPAVSPSWMRSEAGPKR